ncbi:Protein Tat like [Quillaja saponaria]|uniref:Protein Tat like n=1 Tax=Quillaja saponaria TaxID=32244 RepID=A0AAD7PK42_QUISA|nr:Protein Tat like [Quillaja saponaria]
MQRFRRLFKCNCKHRISETHFISFLFLFLLSTINSYLSFSSKFSYVPNQMLPNLDLVILALLHASFIAFTLHIIIFIILIALLFAFFIALLSVFIFDLNQFSSLVSPYFEILKDDLQLGMVLILLQLINQAVRIGLTSKPWFERKVSEFKLNARHFISHVHGLKTAKLSLVNWL